jgi:protein-S-isoprenylcysteine O-methyltransferase Ste14
MNIFWLVLAILVWGLVHSLLASLRAKELARRLLGPAADRLYRLGYNVFAMGSLIPVGWLLLVLPDRGLYSILSPWKVLMLIGQLIALTFLVVGVLQTGVWSFLGLSQLGTPPAVSSGLVTSGLYRFVRHPLYAAGLAYLWLSTMMTINRLVVYACGTVYILVGAWFEERKLRREFGQVYAAYAARTPMLIPFVKGNKSSS